MRCFIIASLERVDVRRLMFGCKRACCVKSRIRLASTRATTHDKTKRLTRILTTSRTTLVLSGRELVDTTAARNPVRSCAAELFVLLIKLRRLALHVSPDGRRALLFSATCYLLGLPAIPSRTCRPGEVMARPILKDAEFQTASKSWRSRSTSLRELASSPFARRRSSCSAFCVTQVDLSFKESAQRWL